MRKVLYVKPEPSTVQGMCCKCGTNRQDRRDARTYRPLCKTCHKTRHGMPTPDQQRRPWHAHKGATCERCGFVPEHPCQLDVDHRDGNKANNDPANWQTLCSNCHRLKGYLARDWDKR